MILLNIFLSWLTYWDCLWSQSRRHSVILGISKAFFSIPTISDRLFLPENFLQLSVRRVCLYFRDILFNYSFAEHLLLR